MKSRALTLFLNPFFQLFIEAVLVTASQIFLKLGASATADVPTSAQWLGFTGLYSKWVWIGIACLVLSFLSWMYVLRSLPLNVAFMLSNGVHVLVPLSCWLFLNEAISPTRWTGIALVTVGLMIVAKPVVKLEERL